ncbi:hypothetical protein GQ53DRAFT_753217, partial [Thozetella sp. PMI_491]
MHGRYTAAICLLCIIYLGTSINDFHTRTYTRGREVSCHALFIKKIASYYVRELAQQQVPKVVRSTESNEKKKKN